MLFLPNEDGQSLVEYALILTAVALVVIFILMVFGDQVYNLWDGIVTQLLAVFG